MCGISKILRRYVLAHNYVLSVAVHGLSVYYPMLSKSRQESINTALSAV